MSSNFTGGNPANGANYAARNAVYRTPSTFYSTVLPAGALSFLLCAGDMRGAVHDGKTCGGAAHFPLFAAGTNFQPLYDLLDAAADGDGDNSGGELPEPAPVVPVVEGDGRTATVTSTPAPAETAEVKTAAAAKIVSRTFT